MCDTITHINQYGTAAARYAHHSAPKLKRWVHPTPEAECSPPVPHRSDVHCTTLQLMQHAASFTVVKAG